MSQETKDRLEQIKKELRDLFSEESWRVRINRKESTKFMIEARKKELKEQYGDAVEFGEERLEGADPGFDYTFRTPPLVTFTVEIDLKDFEEEGRK